jgi:hypothetical protein
MIGSRCPSCGEDAFGLAGTCRRCGARRGRLADAIVAGALALPLLAVGLAVAAVLRGDQLAAATRTGVPADEHIAAGSIADLAWLSAAMSGCDAEARTDPDKLYFLVTPLASVAKDIAPWHEKSINDMGNGLLLRSDDTLDGLKSETLRFYPADYGFRILDQASNTVYKWRPSVGVTRFSTAEPGAIKTFKVQFRTAYGGSDTEWGGSFTRQNASCHWVNAIISK